MGCHTQARQDHIPAHHTVTPALWTTSHLHVIALYGPRRTYTLRSRTCEPNLIQPVRGLFATAIRTNSHLYVSPPRLQSGPRPTYTSRCCICNLDRLPPLRCTVEPAAGTTSRTCSPAPGPTSTSNPPPARSASTSPKRRPTPPSSPRCRRGSFLP